MLAAAAGHATLIAVPVVVAQAGTEQMYQVKTQAVAGSGGSGVVILSIPEANTATFSGGVTQTSTTSGGRRIYTITAAGVSDTVTFA